MARAAILLYFIFCSILSNAQYLNTDSLIIIPGYASPVSICEFDSLIFESPEILPASQLFYFYGMQFPAGKILCDFSLPADGKIISRFGWRSGRMHTGTDIKMSKGDTIYASFDGVVKRTRYFHGYGNLVILDHHSSLETYYAHLAAFLVKPGDLVEKGAPLGLAGSTGRATTNHLHFEIRENNRPYNPELVFDFERRTVRKEVTRAETLANLYQEEKYNGNSGNALSSKIYKVQPGDSLWEISLKFRTTVNSLCQLNNLTEHSVLQIGQVLLTD